jgi:hypothetical protein
MPINIKNGAEIARMREAGSVVALIHARIQEAIAPGVTTAKLDAIARDTLAEAGARSSFLGYHGFPGHICARSMRRSSTAFRAARLGRGGHRLDRRRRDRQRVPRRLGVDLWRGADLGGGGPVAGG